MLVSSLLITCSITLFRLALQQPQQYLPPQQPSQSHVPSGLAVGAGVAMGLAAGAAIASSHDHHHHHHHGHQPSLLGRLAHRSDHHHSPLSVHVHPANPVARLALSRHARRH